MANYDVNIAVRAVTKKAEQALKGIERQVKEIRKVTKKGVEWGRSASLNRALVDLGKVRKTAVEASKAVRGIGERAGFAVLVLGAAKAAKALREAANSTSAFGRAIKFINKETGTTPFKALVEGTTRLRDGFKNLVPGGNKVVAVLGATGKAAKVSAGGVAALLSRIDSLPGAVKAAGVALAAFGPQLPVLASALGDVAGAADKFFGKVPSTQLGKLGRAISGALNRPVEAAVGRFTQLNTQINIAQKNLRELMALSPLSHLNEMLGQARSHLESLHSSTLEAKGAAKDYVDVLRAHKAEQKAINDLVLQAQGLPTSGQALKATQRARTSPERRARIGMWEKAGPALDMNTGQLSKTQKILQQNRTLITNTNQLYNEELRIHLLKVQEIERQERSEARRQKLIAKTAAIEKQRLRTAQRNKKMMDMASSGLIGGGFPLLFGQGGSAAVGGGIGGLIGGAMGGGFGFGVSVVGTAIGQWLEDDEKFRVSLAEINSQILQIGDSSLYTAKAIKELAKQMGGTSEEVIEVLDKAGIDKFGKIEADRITAVFGPEYTPPFLDLAAIRTQNDAKKVALKLQRMMGDERSKEVADLIKSGELLKAQKIMLDELLEKVRTKRMQQIIQAESGPLAATSRVAKTLIPFVDPKEGGREGAISKQERELTRLQGSLKGMFRFITEKSRRGLNVFDEEALTRSKDLVAQINEQVESSNDIIAKATAKYEDRLAYEAKYRELIANGSTPALAKQILQLEKESKAYDKLIEEQLKALDAVIARQLVELAGLKTIGEQTEAYKELAEAIRAAKEERDKLEGKKGTYPGKPKTPGDTIQDEITRIQGALNDLTDPAKRLIAIANGVGNAFAESFKGIASGSMTAREALASFTQNVADMFLQMAAQIAANQIALSILKAFGGAVAGSFGGGGDSFAGVDNATLDSVIGPSGTYDYSPKLAEGGYVSGPTNALIGEGGEGEYVIPESKMDDALAKYAGGARGDDVLAGGGEVGGEGGAGGASSGVIDVTFNSHVINDVSYVTYSDFQAGLQQAAAEGAKLGEKSTLRRLQTSPSTRRRVGV